MTLVCLTSIPPRFATLGETLETLLDQGADGVVLSLPRRFVRFPAAHDAPPLPAGVTLLRTDRDDGPLTKLVAPLRRWPDARIAICDDDCLYAPGWLAALDDVARRTTVACGSAWSVRRLRRAGKADGHDVAQGFSGVLFPEDTFDGGIFDPPRSAWSVDDVWIAGQLARRGRSLCPSPAARGCVTPKDAPAPLQSTRIAGLDRAQANAACAKWLHKRYGIWPPL